MRDLQDPMGCQLGPNVRTHSKCTESRHLHSWTRSRDE